MAHSGSGGQMENNQHAHLILEDEYYIPILQLDTLMPKGTGDNVTFPRPHEEALSQ